MRCCLISVTSGIQINLVILKTGTFIVCRYIYTGSVDVNMGVAKDLLRVADQYLLEGLKRLCEYAIAQVSAGDLSVLEEDLCLVSPNSFLSLVGYLSGKCLSDV